MAISTAAAQKLRIVRSVVKKIIMYELRKERQITYFNCVFYDEDPGYTCQSLGKYNCFACPIETESITVKKATIEETYRKAVRDELSLAFGME